MATLLAIIAVVVVPTSVSASDLAMSEAASRIQCDLVYARSRAILLRSPQCFTCDATQGYYYVSAAPSPTTPLTEPVSHKTYRVFLQKACNDPTLQTMPRMEDFADVQMSSAGFDGGTVLTYSALGAPMVGNVAMVSGKIEIQAGTQRLAIVVDAITGLASIQDLTDTQTQQQGQQAQQGGGLLSWLLGGLGL